MSESFWRRCSTCKSEIGFGRPYWTCSVSTCTRKPSDFVFCSVACWDIHLPSMRHREAWAEEAKAPGAEAWRREQAERAGHAEHREHPEHATHAEGEAPRRRVVAASAPRSSPKPAATPEEVLVVVSKLKAYIRARSGMNTSDGVVEILSDRLRALCDDAIDRAREAGRKTVLDRDF